MCIIRPEDFRSQPWKNGGGITHEIARKEEAGQLLWRLSVAEVASDGPFSAFPELERILTVIEGAGLILDTPGGPIAAHPLEPVRFSGDLPVTGRLLGGPVRDLNVIFDSQRIAAEVRLVTDALPMPAARPAALLCLSGRFRLAGVELPPGAVAFLDAEAPEPEPGATSLLVSLAAAIG